MKDKFSSPKEQFIEIPILERQIYLLTAISLARKPETIKKATEALPGNYFVETGFAEVFGSLVPTVALDMDPEARLARIRSHTNFLKMLGLIELDPDAINEHVLTLAGEEYLEVFLEQNDRGIIDLEHLPGIVAHFESK